MKKSLEIIGTQSAATGDILNEDALGFVAALAREFGGRLDELLAARRERQARIDAGEMPDFLPGTADIRNADWTVADVPADLATRCVEITGPTDRKMMINALNSRADVFMADCEDSLSPTWDNVVRGQVNLRDAAAGTIALDVDGKRYRLNDDTATLIVRPRGWHLVEKHVEADGRAVPAALFDAGLYLYHNAATLKARGTGPYFYLPKLQSHHEAALWADVFRFAEREGILGSGEIKVTVLIETLPAAFEMDEILYALRDYIVGMNCGRWDYIFSFIKTFHRRYDFVLPDRSDVTMTRHFLRSYSLLLIRTCHRRGAYAIGGMAAQIPVKDDADANRRALARVRADKEREAGDGHDGTWVAHPALVEVAHQVFADFAPAGQQLDRLRDDIVVTAGDLLQVPAGRITEAGMRLNIEVALRYLAAWLSGNGCVPINNLMEDAATAEISRAQLWQWLHHATGILDTGEVITPALFHGLLDEELARAREVLHGSDACAKLDAAASLLSDLATADDFEEFLTVPGYALLD